MEFANEAAATPIRTAELGILCVASTPAMPMARLLPAPLRRDSRRGSMREN